MPQPQRLPLTVKPANRDETTSKDARLINCYVDQVGQEEAWVYRRPGLSLQQSVAGASAGLGIYNWQGDIYSIFGGTLYRNAVSVGTGMDTTTSYTFSTSLGATPKLFLTNSVKSYTYDGTNGLVPVAASSTTTVTGTTVAASTVITGVSPSTAGLLSGMHLTGIGIATGATIQSIDSSTQITVSAACTANGTVSITADNYGIPANLVKGSGYLDGTTYVMTDKAVIQGSDLNNPASWNPLNFLTAQIEPDNGVRLAKQLAYIIAFKEWSTEVFYDAGRATGSPLGPVQGGKINYGCIHQDTVQDLEGVLFWVSATRTGSVAVMAMENLKATTVSTPAIERLLQGATFNNTVYSWTAKVDGHRWYVLTLVGSNLTLVYDVTSKHWYQWTDVAGNYLPFSGATFTSNQEVLLQHATDGGIYYFRTTSWTDNGVPIPVDIYTPNFEGGTRMKKYVQSIDFIGDQVTGSLLEVSCSDDDYQTWSLVREVNLGHIRPRLTNCGTFRRRAYHLHHEVGTWFRLQYVELFLDLGVL